MKLTILLLSLYAACALGHGGGLNGQGGDFDRSTGEYHCHREPYFAQSVSFTHSHHRTHVSLVRRFKISAIAFIVH